MMGLADVPTPSFSTPDGRSPAPGHARTRAPRPAFDPARRPSVPSEDVDMEGVPNNVPTAPPTETVLPAATARRSVWAQARSLITGSGNDTAAPTATGPAGFAPTQPPTQPHPRA